MKEAVWDITKIEDLEKAAAAVLEDGGADKVRATVLALSGDLGAGKTTFTQALARQLGVRETVNSPTFVIMKKYELEPATGYKYLVHVDAYRLEDLEELRVLGFDEELSRSGNIVCIEWADKVRELLPPVSVQLNFELVDGKRTLRMKT